MTDSKHNLLLGMGAFVEVDNDGYLVSKPYEGTLGLLIRTYVGSFGQCALKIPRLVADTPQENLHIASLLEEERENCERLFFEDSAKPSDALLPVHNPQASLLTIEAGPSILAELREQKGQWVIAQYAQRGLRFVGVQITEDGLKYFPTRPAELAELERDDFEAAIAESMEQGTVMRHPILIESSGGDQRGTAGITQLRKTKPLTTRSAWYLGLPAVAYRWADRTLEEFVDGLGRLSQAEAKRFTWKEGLGLNLRLLKGVRTLHRKGFIHADLRPANVMQIGRDLDIDTFYLTDYASFGKLQPIRLRATPSPAVGRDHTELGPVLPGGRVSPFYSPERQSAPESESADAALLIPTDTSNPQSSLIILLGWRSDITEAGSGGNRLTARAEEAISGAIAALSQDEHSGTVQVGELRRTSRDLREGDRLRLRELVFEVSRTLPSGTGPFKIMECHGPGWTIHQERALVERRESMDAGADWQLVLLPKVVEIWQWSASTDLYSVGVMLLYTLFNLQWMRRARESENKPERKAGQPPPLPATEGTRISRRNEQAVIQRPPPATEHGADREQLFKTMVETLASIPYARTVWKPIFELCHDLEEIVKLHTHEQSWRIALATLEDGQWTPYEATLNASQIKATLNAIRDASTEQTDDASGRSPFTDKGADTPIKVTDTLLYHALIGVGRLTQTAPGLSHVLEALDNNVASFVLVMHFALSCLYRSEDVYFAPESQGAYGRSALREPFCLHRAARPNGEEKVAERAVARLETILEFVSGHISPMYRTFVCRPDDIIPYKPASSAFLRLENAELSSQIKQLRQREAIVEGLRADADDRLDGLLAKVRVLVDGFKPKGLRKSVIRSKDVDQLLQDIKSELSAHSPADSQAVTSQEE